MARIKKVSRKRKLNKDKVTMTELWTHASSAAFFLFFSIFPMLMLLLSIIPYTHITRNDVFQLSAMLFPDTVESTIARIIDETYGKSLALTSMSAIITIVSASSGVAALRRGFNRIYGCNEKVKLGLPYILLRLKLCLYTINLILAMTGGIFIITFSKKLVHIIEAKLPIILPLVEYLNKIRVVFGILLMTLMFSFLYTMIPKGRRNLIAELPGAVFAAISWSVYSWLFSLYVAYTEMNTMYGSLSAIVLFLMWIFSGMMVLMLGAQLNSRLQKFLVEYGFVGIKHLSPRQKKAYNIDDNKINRTDKRN